MVLLWQGSLNPEKRTFIAKARPRLLLLSLRLLWPLAYKHKPMAEKCCLLFKTRGEIRPRSNLCSKLTQDKRKSSVAMARLKLLQIKWLKAFIMGT
jgi:hypothetical protein